MVATFYILIRDELLKNSAGALRNLTRSLVVFLSAYRPRLSHDHFLTNHLHFVVYLSSCLSTFGNSVILRTTQHNTQKVRTSSESIPYATLAYNYTRSVKLTEMRWDGNEAKRMRFNDVFSHIWTCPGNKLSTSVLLRLIEPFRLVYKCVRMRGT
jgi:hypothetical protein